MRINNNNNNNNNNKIRVTKIKRRELSAGYKYTFETSSYSGLKPHEKLSTDHIQLKPSLHFHGLDAGSVTVVIRDYPWAIRPGSVDVTVMFRDQLARFRHLDFSVARFSTCSKISFLT